MNDQQKCSKLESRIEPQEICLVFVFGFGQENQFECNANKFIQFGIFLQLLKLNVGPRIPFYVMP